MRASVSLAGVIGFPVSHSLSPRLHEFWLRQQEISGLYIPVTSPPEKFSESVRVLQQSGFAGVNVTVPHKESAHAVAMQLDSAALTVGAANLLLFNGDKIEGWNTDVAGLRESLVEEFGRESFAGNVAALLGAGGAARSAVVALAELGVREIRVLSRNAARTQNLVAELGPRVRATLTTVDWGNWHKAAAGLSLLINATPAGMRNRPALELSLEPLSQTAAVYDLVYNPFETALVKQARARGHRAAGGLGMLVHQAVPAFESFFGAIPADIRGARAELEKALAE